MPQPSSRDPDADRIAPVDPEAHRAAGLAGLDRVQQQVEQHVLQLGVVDAHAEPPARPARPRSRPSARGPWARSAGPPRRASARDRPGRPASPGPLERRRKCWVMPAAAQELLAGDRALSSTRAPARAASSPSAAARGAQDPLDAGEHRGQRRVQLVREARGQQAQRGEPVRLGQPGLGRAPLGDVAPDLDHLDDRAGRPADRRGVHLLPDGLAVRGPALADADLALARLRGRPGSGSRRCRRSRRPASRQERAEHLLARPRPCGAGRRRWRR